MPRSDVGRLQDLVCSHRSGDDLEQVIGRLTLSVDLGIASKRHRRAISSIDPLTAQEMLRATEATAGIAGRPETAGCICIHNAAFRSDVAFRYYSPEEMLHLLNDGEPH
jgi:hypothetical protein